MDALEELAWAAGVSPQESGEWTWGELCAAVRGWELRRKKVSQDTACLLYQFGLYFEFGRPHPAPDMWNIFPLWDDDEIREMMLQRAQAEMEQMFLNQ